MKKSLIFVGILAIGYANAQSGTDYSGRVGINTDTPSATLNVKSKTGTTSETKNFELSNADGKILLSAFDDGHIGIGTDGKRPYYKFEVLGGDVMTDKNLISQRSSNEGGAIILSNPSKTSQDSFRVWTLYNMTGSYGNSLQFWGYANGGNVNKSIMSLFDNGYLGIGNFHSKSLPTEKIDIQGNARVRELPNNIGTGTDKLVVVDDTGVLKSVDRNTIVSGEIKPTATEATCTDTNLGTIHFKERTLNGQKVGTLGFCSKQDGKHIWVYISNGGNILQSDGANKFGEGL